MTFLPMRILMRPLQQSSMTPTSSSVSSATAKLMINTSLIPPSSSSPQDKTRGHYVPPYTNCCLTHILANQRNSNYSKSGLMPTSKTPTSSSSLSNLNLTTRKTWFSSMTQFKSSPIGSISLRGLVLLSPSFSSFLRQTTKCSRTSLRVQKPSSATCPI